MDARRSAPTDLRPGSGGAGVQADGQRDGLTLVVKLFP